MAHAYSTIANRGVRVSGSLAASPGGPVAIERVGGGDRDDRNERRRERVFPQDVGETAQELLAGVVSGGTGTAAQIDEFAAGKTGTTENYGDAWFAGFNEELTVAVWVGYPDKLQPMETEYRGQPVAGGTYPAEIWADLMRSWIEIREARAAERGANDDDETTTTPVEPSVPTTPTPPVEGVPEQEVPAAPAAPAPAEPAPQQPAPAPEPAPTPAPAPAPTPQPAPGGGGTGGGASP
jgi:penicillin-binding protein 1A